MEEFSSLSIKTSKKIHIKRIKNLVTKKVNNLKNEEKSTKDFSLKIVKMQQRIVRNAIKRALIACFDELRCCKKDV